MGTALRIGIHPLRTVFVYPVQCPVKFFLIINSLVHTAENLGHIHPFRAHAKIMDIKGRIHKGSHDPHGNRTDIQIGFIFQLADSQCSLRKQKDLTLHILRDTVILHVLDILSVDGKAGKLHLVMGRHGSGKVNSAGALCAVKAPDCLGGHRIDVDRFQRVAPAWGNA